MSVRNTAPWWLAIALSGASFLSMLWLRGTDSDRIDVQRLQRVETKIEAVERQQERIESKLDRLVDWALGSSTR